MTQLGLLTYQKPQPAPRAPEGVKRAAKAGSRVDSAILAWCRANVGVDRPRESLRSYVEAQVEHVDPETPGRRLRALAGMGLVTVAKAGLGVIRVEAVSE